MDFKLLFLSELLFGCLTAIVARSRGRSPWVWFVIGMLLTWIGLVILLILPSYVAQKAEEVPLVSSLSTKKGEWGNTSDWFYVDHDKKVQGPVGIAVLRGLWNTKALSGETWVWHEKVGEWKKISSIEGLAETFL